MNRMEEYQALLEELDRPVPALETTLDRAMQKKRKRTAGLILRPLAGLAACFAVFVLLVNFCAPVAYACSRLPVLKELAAAVTFSRSLSDAVENDFVQPMDLKQTEGDITAEIVYLIVDQKQVNVFYRLSSDVYTDLAADPRARTEDGRHPGSYHNSGKSGDLYRFVIDFVDDNVPDSLQVRLNVYSNAIDRSDSKPEDSDNSRFPDVWEEPEYLAQFDFLLEFDPEFTASGKVFPVNQTVELDGQRITITDIEVYPTHMRIDIADDPENTAWLERLDFYIETDWGMRFDPVSSGITATGSGDDDTRSMTSYRADSTYFYEAEHLKLVITGAKWLNKDMETTYVNLATGETGPLPEGVEFVSAERDSEDWIVTFRGAYDEEKPMYQMFLSTYYDAEGIRYEFNAWSTQHGERDESGAFTYFTQTFPLHGYPYDEVWLSPAFSHEWAAEDLIVITVE